MSYAYVPPVLTTVFRAIPGTTSEKFREAIKEILEIGTGQRGNPLDRFITLRDLVSPDVVRYLNDQTVSVTRPDEGVFVGQSRIPDAPSNLILQSSDDADRISAFNIALTWTLPVEEQDLAATQIWVATSNDRSTAVLTGIVTYPQTEYTYINPKPDTDHYFWIRVVDWAGNYSEWEPSGATAGFAVQRADTVQETIDRILNALKGEAPDLYNAGTTYYTDDRVRYVCGDGTTRTYIAVGNNFSGQAPETGDPLETNTTYWNRTGILNTGEINGEAFVGIDGSMVVDGTIVTRNLDAECVTAAKIAANTITTNQIAIGANIDLDTQVTDGTTYSRMLDAWKHTSDATLIDGGKIYTDSITANAIDAGTITATEIAAGTITANEINGTTLSAIFALLGSVEIDSTGALYTTGKTSYSDADAGIWMGYDVDSYKLNIGNGTNYLKWTGTTLNYAGGFDGATAGSVTFVESVTQSNGSGMTPLKIIEFNIVKGGTIRSYFRFYAAGGQTSYAQVYRNDQAIGDSITNAGLGWQYYTIDTDGWTTGDSLAIYGWSTASWAFRECELQCASPMQSAVQYLR